MALRQTLHLDRCYNFVHPALLANILGVSSDADVTLGAKRSRIVQTFQPIGLLHQNWHAS